MTRDIGNTAGGVILPTFTTTLSGNSVNYLTVTVTGVSAGDFANVEALLDDGVSGASSTTGAVRYNAGSSTLTYLAFPIQ